MLLDRSLSRVGAAAARPRHPGAERRRRCQAFYLVKLAETGHPSRALAELEALRSTDPDRFLKLTCGRSVSAETLRNYCRDTPRELVGWAYTARHATRRGEKVPPLPSVTTARRRSEAAPSQACRLPTPERWLSS